MDEDQGGPPLLAARSTGAAVVAAAVVPALLGASAGYLLGVDKTAYEVLSLLALMGGYFAGQEHRSAASGALRGLLSGSTFGGAALAVHTLSGRSATVALPHPAILLVAIAAAVSVIAAALGGRRRALGIPARDVNLRRLGRPEIIGVAGAVTLIVVLFAPWFATACDPRGLPRGCDRNSMIHGMRGSFDAFSSYRTLQWILLVISTAPLAGTYLLVVRSRPHTWRAGEVAMIAGMAGGVLVFANGILLGRPGGNSIQNVAITLKPGYFVAIGACLLIALGGALRESRYLKSRRVSRPTRRGAAPIHDPANRPADATVLPVRRVERVGERGGHGPTDAPT